MGKEKKIIQSFLDGAGIAINGSNPCDPHVRNEDMYARVLRHGSLGLGESYVEGWWDCQRLDQFFDKILVAGLDSKIKQDFALWRAVVFNFLFNAGRKSKAFEVGQKHYDIGNDLYRAMLDKRLTYTCGYWKDAKNLDEAQEAKLDLVCKKIGLKAGDHVLDIGCGWGSFLKFAAQRYGARGTGVTVSKEQAGLGKELCAGLSVEIKLQDYRDIEGNFDHVVSLGMFEHVGVKNYRAYMAKVQTVLKDGGMFLLHTIGSDTVAAFDLWVEKYIFPNSAIPSIAQIGKSVEGLFVMEDWHNFGADYDKTLMAWHHNFEDHWEKIKSRYDERFHRMWRYYLLLSAGSFRSRRNQLWQVVLSKKGVPGGYISLR